MLAIPFSSEMSSVSQLACHLFLINFRERTMYCDIVRNINRRKFPGNKPNDIFDNNNLLKEVDNYFSE